MDKPGYHLVEIPKGEFGDFSKIVEEFEELKDAEEQNCAILQLIELSDLLGAMEAYAFKHFDVSLNQIINFKNVTKRAFENGHR